MRLTTLLLCLVSLLLFSGTKCPSDNAKDQPHHATIKFSDHSFDVYHIDLQHDSLVFFWKNDSAKKMRSIRRLKNYVESTGGELLMATNGGMYLKDGSPKGLYIENQQTLIPLNTDSAYGNFYLMPNGIFLIGEQGAKVIPTTAFSMVKEKVFYATQSGPMLMIDGKMHPAFNKGSQNTYIRSGVGIIDAQHLVFVISNEQVNFYTFASFFQKEFGCKNALYLDGAISKMYIKASGRDQLDGNFGCMIGHVKRKKN